MVVTVPNAVTRVCWARTRLSPSRKFPGAEAQLGRAEADLQATAAAHADSKAARRQLQDSLAGLLGASSEFLQDCTKA